MSDYSAVAPPPQQNFNQSTAFAAALQRAKQIAAKINPNSSGGNDTRQKRPLEDASDFIVEPEPKKLAGSCGNQNMSGGPGNRQNSTSGGPPSMGATMNNGPPALGGGQQINEDIKVPDKMVGLIIGRGGEQITRLQAESGCKIQMAPDSNGMPERVCSLSGSRDAINRAKELIMNIVHQRGRSEGITGLDLGPGMGQGNFQVELGGGNNQNMSSGGNRNFVEIMVPGPKVGLIIGKGGETIKQLQERSGAKMVVIQDGPNQEQEKPLRISGDLQKVEYAKQLVYDLIAEKEIQAYNRRGGGNGGNGTTGSRNQDDRQQQYNDYGNNEVEVLVPRAAVGVVIGKGGDMIKKIQAETGARVQFQQAREEGPGERRCYLSGKPQNVEQARQRIEELIDSVIRREDGNGSSQRGSNRNNRNNDRYDNRNNRNGNANQDYGGWDDRRQQQPPQEVTFTVPANKCGVIIGRGGETIKQINQQSGAHCELDRRSQNQQNSSDKTFIIRGDPDQIETAKRIISDKVQMQLNFIPSGGNQGNSLPTAYPGMAPQGYTPQGWYPQQWGTTAQAADATQQQQGNQSISMNPQTGQPDYSLQWAEYYRSLGMHREAEMIEQQAKTKASSAPQQPQAGAPVAQQAAAVGQGPSVQANGSQPDYSAQWAKYYRSLGKHKEAEAIEAQMKNKNTGSTQGGVNAVATTMAGNPGAQQSAAAAGYAQQPYGAYQAAGGFYGGQGQSGGTPQGVPQGQYGFAGYGYGSAPAPQENQ